MRTVRLESFAPLGWPRPAVTVGNFDGVHRGHQALVAAAVSQARRTDGVAVVLTFEPHPARILSPARAPLALMTAAQKGEALAALGVDGVAVLPFTRAIARLEPAAFVRSVLVGAVGARHVVVGEAFRFGRDQAGDVEQLAVLGAAEGFTVEALGVVSAGGVAISSSRVREAVLRGDVAEAATLLGSPYALDGRVVPGDQRGRTIGVPTANLQPENEILPARGVYAGRLRRADGSIWPAVVNVGERPTFGGGRVSVEAHLLDFSGDLYGAPVRLSFVARLREERRFAGPEALVRQIRDDIERARSLLSKADGAGV